MSKLKFVVSLTNNDNDYQIEQAKTAQSAAQRLGVEVEIVHAGNEGIVQSQQLLKIIQSPASARSTVTWPGPARGCAAPLC